MEKLKPIDFLINHIDHILPAYRAHQPKIHQVWVALEGSLPELARAMAENTFKMQLPIVMTVMDSMAKLKHLLPPDETAEVEKLDKLKQTAETEALAETVELQKEQIKAQAAELENHKADLTDWKARAETLRQTAEAEKQSREEAQAELLKLKQTMHDLIQNHREELAALRQKYEAEFDALKQKYSSTITYTHTLERELEMAKLKQTESDAEKETLRAEVEKLKQTGAPSPAKNIDGWTIAQDAKGYFKLYKSFGGQVYGIYLGKTLDTDLARQKIVVKMAKLRQDGIVGGEATPLLHAG